MNKSIKYILLWCLTCYSCFYISAQEIKQDSSAISVNYFKENIKERYTDSDFNYSINDTIKFLIQSPISSVFSNESKTIDSIHFTEETLSVTNFDKLIKKALKNNNYRLATRYEYLKSLQQLSQKEIIKWNYDKTNSEYLNEIKNKTTKDLFKKASYIYDYVWYGEFFINKDHFNQNQLVFNQLNKATHG